MDFSKFKKVHEDHHSSTLMHPEGHQIKIAKSGLSPKLKEQLKKLPMHFDEGGGVPTESIPLDLNPSPPMENQGPVMAPQFNFNPFSGPASVEAKEIATEQPTQAIPQQQSTQAPPHFSMPDRAPSASPVGIPGVDSIKGMQAGYDQRATGIQQQVEAQGQLGQQEAEAAERNASAMQKVMADHEQHYQVLDGEIQNTIKDIQDPKNYINPNHYINSKSTLGKVSTAIGLILGGIGGGLLGQENPAMKFLQSQIQNDVEAQKANLGQKNNILSAYFHQMGNLNDATKMTYAFYNDLYSNDIKKAMAQSKNPMAQALGNQALGQLKIEKQQALGPLALKKSIFDSMKNGNISHIDPAELVPHMVPKEHQDKAFGEIKAAENTAKMGDSIKSAFEQAVKENTAVKTGFGLARTPGSVYALHQAMQPTFADLEGTVRQAAMDNTFKNITPAAGDSDHTIETKRKSLHEYLQSKQSAPTARGYGIDLSKFSRTSYNPEMRLPPQQQQWIQWAKSNPSDPKSSLVLKKLGVQ